jgi:hypothetical protein
VGAWLDILCVVMEVRLRDALTRTRSRGQFVARDEEMISVIRNRSLVELQGDRYTLNLDGAVLKS